MNAITMTLISDSGEKKIDFTTEETEFLIKYIFEDEIQYFIGVKEMFQEFPDSLMDEEGGEQQISAIERNKKVFEKLKQIGINTLGLEK